MRTHPEAIGTHDVLYKRSCRIPKEEEDDGGEILGGLGTDGGDEYFCSLKVHRLTTQI